MTKTVTGASHTADSLLPEQVRAVQAHLQSVLDSHAFAGSRRTQDFLRLIVTHALQGDTDSLRERTIGAEMFGRPIGYDTGSDSVVRVRASEVRKKLARYYEETSGQPSAVRFELPSGSYVPRFHFDSGEPPAATAAPEPKPAEPPSVESAEHAPVHTATVQTAPAPSHTDPSAVAPRQNAGRPLRLAIAAAAVLVLAVASYFVFAHWRAAQTRQGIRSIAILPLKNLSGDPAQDYFADGMTEELINELGQVSTVRVTSLTSSMTYKGTRKRLPEIARELSVDAVVEGGVVRDGNQIRISAQLVDAASDRPVWAKTYVRNLTDVLAWQGEVAQAIAEEIRTTVTPQEQARLSRNRPVDPQAQDLYLHGILLRSTGGCPNAVPYFNKAIALDPRYAEAHSALASCYGMMGETGYMNYQEAFSHQKAEALQAIALDDSLSEAHAELANTAMTLDWDWPTAEAQFRRALALNPSSATSHQKYAFYLVRTGHPREAIAEVERGVELDPVSGSTFHTQGFVYYLARQYDQALEVTRTVRGLKINLLDWNFLTGAIYAEKGMYHESIAAFLATGSGPYTLGHLGNAYARAGQPEAARKLIARLEDNVRTRGIGRYEIALIYAGLGDKNQAFDWLEEAYRAHDVGLVYLKIDPCLDPLRSSPRFASLLDRVGLR